MEQKPIIISFVIILLLVIIALTANALPEVATDKSEYLLGEKVLISVNNATVDSVIKIIFGQEIYRFMDELSQPMEFLPSATGDYTVSLEYDVNNEVRTSFIVNPQPDLSTSVVESEGQLIPETTEVIPGVNAGTDAVPTGSQTVFPPNFAEAEGITVSTDFLIIKNHADNIINKNMELYDSVFQKKYLSNDSSTFKPLGTYDVELSLDNLPIKSILFKGLESYSSSSLELRIDDLTGNEEKAGSGSKQFYVIDPTSLNFTSAYVTVTAKGDTLMKCKDWNYAEQKCYGTWNRIMDITPGENYTFLLTPEDPAYNETTRIADNCYNEKAGAACTAAELAAINTTGGTTYTFNKNAGSPVRVGFENESLNNISQIVNCTVFVKGYDNEGNSWTLQLGNWSSATWDSAGTGKVAPNPDGTINWSCSSHFGFANDAARFNNFAVRISTNDGGTPATAYIDYVYVRINFTKKDQTAPYYSNIAAAPPSPATYSPTGTYQFNTTWQDNEGVNRTWIEHNFTGTFQNQTMNRTGNTSYYNYTNLAAGNYAWRTYANDTAGNLNNTMPWQTYTINKAGSILNLTLNRTNNNFTINNSGSVNITGSLLAGQGNISIYEQGILISQGLSPRTSIRTYTSPGNYNITLAYNTTQNYSANQQTLFVMVQDTIPPGQVTNLRATNNGTTWILWNWTNPIDLDFNHTEIWLNRTFMTNTTNQYYNATGLLSNTNYEIEVRTVDNWTTPNKGTFVNNTAATKISGDITPPAIINIRNTSITDSSVNISWDTNEIATSIVKYGTSPGSYPYNLTDLTLVLNHTIILTGLSANTTYYYAVNSSDSSGNSNQSIEYTFKTLADQTSPYYSNIAAAPPSPATYSPTGTYQFNTTWQDNQGINTTRIEHNFTGTFQNQTMNRTGNTSYYNYTNLAAGNYAWRTYANDTAGNLNNTMPWQTYIVQQAASSINLRLNGTSGNYSINESQNVNITGLLVTGQGNISIYENGIQISQGLSPQASIRNYLVPGVYNITLVYQETQNYTGNAQTYFVTVNDTRAPWINLIDPPNTSTDVDGDVVFTFDVNDTSDVMNCSLYINGTYNQEKEILTRGQNTFTLNSLTNGNYTWYVNCSDHANHYNISATWKVNVKIGEYYPYLRPASCSDNSGGCTPSNMNNTPGTWEEHGTLQKGTGQANYVYINFSQPSIPAGSTIHWMYIYYDKYQTTIDGFLRLEWINGTNNITICSVIFGSSTAYAHDAVNCSFTSSTMPNLTQINNGLKLRAEFYYSGNPGGVTYGTDEAYINLKYTEDVTPPTVELIGPSSYHRPGMVNFTYIPEDANLVNCTLYGDFNGSWLPNISDTDVISGQADNLTINLSEGFYTWNVKCCDIATNCAFDLIGGPYSNGNYTVNITNPDLIISDIMFNITDSQAKEGMNITINATIKNQGNVNVTETFTVQFYLGDPDSGGIQIGSDQIISELKIGENKTVNITWVIDQGGPRNIYVIVDPPLASNGIVKESREDNNKNNKTINIPSYNYFHGMVESNIYLGNIFNQSIYFYAGLTNVTGNIFVTDEGSTISFSSLQAIGSDINNNSASNDFNNTDTALNTTSYNDSIRKTWTAGTDMPIATKSMTVFNRQINNIPVINSTSTSSFVTGILWDTSDGGAQYDGTQDILFVTQINKSKTGEYGTYDYEIKLPVNLKNYHGSGTNVEFYSEMI